MNDVWLALPALLTLVFVWTLVQFPVDFWHHAVTGRIMWQTGTLAGVDSITFTIAGQPITNQSWLAQLGLFGLFELGGFALAQFTAGLCYAAAVGLVTWLVWRRTQDVPTACGLGLVALALCASNFGVRTQTPAVLLLAVELAALWCWPGRRWIVALVGAVELLWTNVHGTFPLGVALPGVFFIGAGWTRSRAAGLRAAWRDRTVRCYLGATGVAAAAMFCNPHPAKTIDYVLGVASKAAARGIQEWLPTSVTTYTGALFAASVLGVAIVLLLGRKRLGPVETILLVLFAALGCRAQRMVIWWALVMPPAVAPQVTAMLARWRRTPRPPAEPSRAGFVALLILVALAAASTPWTRWCNPLLPPAKRLAHAPDEPEAALRFLEQSGLRGRVFNTIEWGAYLSWHFDPRIKVFIDPRIDVYEDDVWAEYERIATTAPGWEESLGRYSVDVVGWNRQASRRLSDALARSPRWRRVYQDDLAVVFVRTPPSGR